MRPAPPDRHAGWVARCFRHAVRGTGGASGLSRRQHGAPQRGRNHEDRRPAPDDVVQELRWDPQVAEPDHIGVAAADGAVTLTGHTTTYAEKLAAARAAERVYGVRTTVANDLQVRVAGS